MKKTTDTKTAKQPEGFSVNRLSELLNCDRRTISKAIHTEEVEPIGDGANGPLYRKGAVIAALRYMQKDRQRLDPTEELAHLAERNTLIMAGLATQHPEEFEVLADEVDEMLWHRENGK